MFFYVTTDLVDLPSTGVDSKVNRVENFAMITKKTIKGTVLQMRSK